MSSQYLRLTEHQGNTSMLELCSQTNSKGLGNQSEIRWRWHAWSPRLWPLDQLPAPYRDEVCRNMSFWQEYFLEDLSPPQGWSAPFPFSAWGEPSLWAACAEHCFAFTALPEPLLAPSDILTWAQHWRWKLVAKATVWYQTSL